MHRSSTGNGFGPARTLLFSHRNLYEKEVWRCSFREFEGIVENVEAVDVLAPKPAKHYEFRRRNAMRIGKYFDFILDPIAPQIILTRDYDLFFAVCEKPSELLNYHVVANLKERCRVSICWLVEFYVKDIPHFKSVMKVLEQFDYVLFMFSGNEPFQDRVGAGSMYLPAGIDTLSFCPYPNPPRRSIDVLSIGRRSEKMHQTLLSMAKKNGIFYVYDTINDLHARSLDEHRLLMANMAKRSRYFVVNPSKVDMPGETGGQSEFGYRYFEGAAPGTVMIGEVPNNRNFGKMFHWPDAVIHVPFDSERVEEVIREMDEQPERQEKIRRANVVQCLRYHDWCHRWETILNLAGLEPMPRLLERKTRLETLAKQIEHAGLR